MRREERELLLWFQLSIFVFLQIEARMPVGRLLKISR